MREKVREVGEAEGGEEAEGVFSLEISILSPCTDPLTWDYSGFARSTRTKPSKPKSDKLCIFFQKTGTTAFLYPNHSVLIRSKQRILQVNVHELKPVPTFTIRRKSRCVLYSSVQTVLELLPPAPSRTLQTHIALLTAPTSLTAPAHLVLMPTSSFRGMRKCVENSSNTVGATREKNVRSDMSGSVGDSVRLGIARLRVVKNLMF